MGKKDKKEKRRKKDKRDDEVRAVEAAVAPAAAGGASLDELNENGRMARKYYEQKLVELQIELIKLQRWVVKKGHKVLVIFEGRDGAGKGGTILRIMQHLNPRAARKVALNKPSEVERGQWYFQRYAQHLPAAGEIVLFDRSWYNRAGVERVMGFCTDEEYTEFMRAVPEFETMVVNSGVKLLKVWLEVSREEQARRLEARKKDPLKQWKLSPMDDYAQEKWEEYSVAKREMFIRTHQPHAPWFVIRSDDKKRARINCIRGLLRVFDYSDKDERVAIRPDPAIVGHALNPEFGL
jgi:polyphosphate kinase 2